MLHSCTHAHYRKLPYTQYQSICSSDSPTALADPYLNTDAGTMSPFEHGEVFVLDDGGEVCFASKLLGNRSMLDLYIDKDSPAGGLGSGKL